MTTAMIVQSILSSLLIGQLCHAALHTGGILYPRDSETREVTSLDGYWNFVLPTSNDTTGLEERWYDRDLSTDVPDGETIPMPVPSSYNDVVADARIRDYVGTVWYDRIFFAPTYWSEVGRVWLRFDSVSYAARVWVNGELVAEHEIGHLPFLVETTDYLRYGQENRITVAVNNTLTLETLPQGKVEVLDTGRKEQGYSFGYFHYSGIHRSVRFYTTPKTYIDDITVTTVEASSEIGRLKYNVSVVGDSNVTYRVSLSDKSKVIVAKSEEATGTLSVDKPNLWWPYLMHPEPGYLYSLQVELLDSNGNLVDQYVQPVGIRYLNWTNSGFFINGARLYLQGFGHNEDSDFRGKGLDLPVIIRDYNLFKWIGANVYRASNHPYAEEVLDLADQMGIMVIDECPGIGLKNISDTLLTKHQRSLTELINRDKNRPSVIMWSAASEPAIESPDEYFRQIIDHIKSLDTSRPTTIIEAETSNSAATNQSQYVDIVSFNHYEGWHYDPGDMDLVTKSVVSKAEFWHKKFGKPIIMQGYGSGTIEGYHTLPDFIWSEEYQVELLSKHFAAFDSLRRQNYFLGEFVCSFADYKTKQDYYQVGGNKMGVFTRNRQSKPSAQHLRRRYWRLAKELYDVELPDDLDSYVIQANSAGHDEL